MARAVESPCATRLRTEVTTTARLGRYSTSLVPFVYSIRRLFLPFLSALPHTPIYCYYAVFDRPTHPLLVTLLRIDSLGSTSLHVCALCTSLPLLACTHLLRVLISPPQVTGTLRRYRYLLPPLFQHLN
jgi:hypothetical protein